jgi:hypothetical protein
MAECEAALPQFIIEEGKMRGSDVNNIGNDRILSLAQPSRLFERGV